MLATLVLLASCGSDHDMLMDEILVAGRADDYDKVFELEDKLYKQKLTVDQARRLIFEIEPKAALLVYEGGSWNEDATYEDYLDIPCPCDEAEAARTSQSQRQRDPVYLYYCKFCRTLVKANESNKPRPNSGHCTQSFHSWMEVCEYGTLHGFRCSKCGLEITTDTKPINGNSCIQGDHQWRQIY